MKNLFKSLSVLTILSFVFFISGSTIAVAQQKQPKPWAAPETAKKAKNPVKSDDENLKAGKTLYAKHCKSCHGATGKGDGPKSRELETSSGDFTAAKFQAQSDGEIHYKIKEGRDDMPSFKKKIADEEEIWSIVNYIRTLK